MNSIIDKIRQELEENIDEKAQRTSQNFFKEKIKFYGVKTATVNKIGKKYFKSIKDRTKNDIFDLCDEFWQSGYIEESFIACKWSYFVHEDYETNDFAIFEKWVDSYVNNWASCDTLWCPKKAIYLSSLRASPHFRLRALAAFSYLPT